MLGFWGPLAQTAYISNIVTFFLIECIYFFTVISTDLDLSLKSQVLHDGQVVLIGLNRYGIEKFHVKLLAAQDDDNDLEDLDRAGSSWRKERLMSSSIASAAKSASFVMRK